MTETELQAPAEPPRRVSRRTVWIAAAVTAAVVVAGGAVTGVAIANENHRHDHITQAHGEVAVLTGVAAANADAREALADELAAAHTVHTELAGFLEQTEHDVAEARLGVDHVAAMEAALTTLGATITELGVIDPSAETVTLINVAGPLPVPTVTDDLSSEAATAILDELAKRTAAEQSAIAQVEADRDGLASDLRALVAAVVAAQLELPALVEAALAGNAQATAETRTAFADAAVELAGTPATAQGLSEALAGYFAAHDALAASHRAETARKAAEQQPNSPRGTTPRNNGGGGGGGGGNDGGPPAPPPPPPPDQNRYVRTNAHYVSWTTCAAAGAGWLYNHDPGPGGTSIVTVAGPWSYKMINGGTTVSVHVCMM